MTWKRARLGAWTAVLAAADSNGGVKIMSLGDSITDGYNVDDGRIYNYLSGRCLPGKPRRSCGRRADPPPTLRPPRIRRERPAAAAR